MTIMEGHALVLVPTALAIVGPSAVLVVTMKRPATRTEFGNTGHEVVGLEHDLFCAVLAIASPHETVGKFFEGHHSLLSARHSLRKLSLLRLQQASQSAWSASRCFAALLKSVD
jgi:hypothetical protein